VPPPPLRQTRTKADHRRARCAEEDQIFSHYAGCGCCNKSSQPPMITSTIRMSTSVRCWGGGGVRHHARAPVHRGVRLALQCLDDDALDLRIVRGAPGRGSSSSPLNPALDKTTAPFANRLHRHPLARCHRLIAQSPRRIPRRSAPATPKLAPSCPGAHSLPEPRQLRPTARSSVPGDPFASPAPVGRLFT
jgi:hypothetical protein